MRAEICYVLAGASIAQAATGTAKAQDRLNQADPSIIERALPKVAPPATPSDPMTTAVPSVAADLAVSSPRIASAIVVDGGAIISRAAFSDAVLPFIGRNLSSDDLAQLSRAVADVARVAGFPFASAWIEPQAMTSGLLRVRLDAGTIAAVRVIGAINPAADRILTRILVGDQPVRRGQLERAILLVGDLPGVTVQGSKYIRQDGFGILLVTISQDRASAYAQIDNRGSKEVGPIRSTLLGNLRGVAGPGDELSLIAAQTPLQWSEFMFVRARYSAPIDASGATLSASASYGRTHPGAALRPLDVIGKSVDVAANYSKPLIRRRSRSAWAAFEFRSLRSDQTLLGSALRNDRLATLTASVNAQITAGRGILRGELRLTGGLPFRGVTHRGAPRSSRSDGDARFVTVGYDADWATPLSEHWSLAVASEGQLASRPLLATSEIGAGGPSFGRAYDYAERTGDNGILGSAELRFDAGRVIPGVIDRLQVYGSVDGGYVSNLRNGAGGGSLISTAAGVRTGLGRLSGMVEIGMPLNKDRFDTGNRAPRISFRLSRIF